MRDNQTGKDDLFPAADLPAALLPQRVSLRLPDGYRTSLYIHRRRDRHRPAGLPVLYIHGIQSHPGWFVGSAAHLAGAGHAVFQVTRRGSGDNAADRGHAVCARQLLDDTSAAVAYVIESSGARAVHLLGVSWGGKLLACYAAVGRPDNVASLTLIAPGIIPRVDVRPWTKAGIALSLLVAPRRRFRIPLDDVALFTDHEPMRQYLRDDPLRLTRATARLLWASRQLDGMLAGAPGGAITVPTTLLVAERDRIIRNESTRAAVERLTAGRVVVEHFDSAHTIEFEPNTGPFYRALAAALVRAEAGA